MENKSLSSILDDIVKKSGFVFIGKIIGVALTMVFTFIVARFIGAEIYGKYVYIFSILSFFSIFIRLGLDNGILYFIPKLRSENKKEEIENFITTTLFFVIIASIIVILFLRYFGAGWLSTILNKPEIYDGLRLMAPMLVLMGLQALIISIFKSYNSVKEFVFATNIIKPITQSILIIIFAYVGYKFYGIVIAVSVGFILAIGFLLIKLRDKIEKLNFGLDYLNDYKKVVIYSAPIFLNGVVAFFIQKTDIFMIGYFLTNIEVGVYDVALKVGTLSVFILTSFNTLFAPRISELYGKERMDQVEQLYKKITNYVISITFFLFLMILIFNQEIMLIFGREFLIGSTALVIIGLGQIVNAGVGSAGYMNMMTGNSQYELYISSVAIFLNVGLNYLMIPTMGINGAATASMLSNAFKNLGRLFFVWRDHKIHPYSKEMGQNLLKVALLGVLVFAFKIFIFDKIFYSFIQF